MIMIRLFSFKRYAQIFVWLAAFFLIKILFFHIRASIRQTHDRSSRLSNLSETPSFFYRADPPSISRYFQLREQSKRRSASKTILPNARHSATNKTSYLIYEYTRHRSFCRRSDSTTAYLSTCPFRNCYFTCNSSLMNSSDAILAAFATTNNYKSLFDLNTHRNPEQVWMLWHDEPFVTPQKFNSLLFNWTITYRYDADVSVGSYGVAYRKNPPTNTTAYEHWLSENYQQRAARAVWFVSNCHSRHRLAYYQQLKDHFPISVFGKCAVNGSKGTQQCKRASQCESQMLSTSKFYLAFESQTKQRDYITEKFWRSFARGTIPVVLGPKRQYYERIAPPNSFIYARDFASPAELAKYLNKVASNLDEYDKYQQWRVNYETQYAGSEVERFRFCEMCYKLNTARDRTWYTNLRAFFSETDARDET